jgi:hypothetical protein
MLEKRQWKSVLLASAQWADHSVHSKRIFVLEYRATVSPRVARGFLLLANEQNLRIAPSAVMSDLCIPGLGPCPHSAFAQVGEYHWVQQLQMPDGVAVAAH